MYKYAPRLIKKTTITFSVETLDKLICQGLIANINEEIKAIMAASFFSSNNFLTSTYTTNTDRDPNNAEANLPENSVSPKIAINGIEK